MFLIPVASVVLFLFLWWGDMLDRPYVVGILVLLGIAGQLFAPRFSTVWLAAFVLSAGVAIYLAIRLKLS